MYMEEGHTWYAWYPVLTDNAGWKWLTNVATGVYRGYRWYTYIG